MSWFFLATKLGKDGKSSESKQYDSICASAMKSGSKELGTATPIKLDKTKFKIGTLDQLVKLNDALVKVDYSLEGVLRKIKKQAEDISEGCVLKIETNEATQEIPFYVSNFGWDDTKYPRSRSLIDISQIISEKMHQIDTDMKKHIEEYNELRAQLFQFKKKEDGNFLSRDLGDIVYGNISESNFVHNSKFLSNVLIIVPKSKEDQFKKNYELVGEGVVPRSHRDLGVEDKDGNKLYRVVVMSNSVDSFLIKCKSKSGFTARQFEYDEEKYQQELEEAKKIEAELGEVTGKLERRCYFTFSELYVGLIHLKVMRTYIDGVLRYGIPPKFLLTIVESKPSQDKTILKKLTELYADEGAKDMYGTKEEIGDSEDFFPFVYVPVNVV